MNWRIEWVAALGMWRAEQGDYLNGGTLCWAYTRDRLDRQMAYCVQRGVK